MRSLFWLAAVPLSGLVCVGLGGVQPARSQSVQSQAEHSTRNRQEIQNSNEIEALAVPVADPLENPLPSHSLTPLLPPSPSTHPPIHSPAHLLTQSPATEPTSTEPTEERSVDLAPQLGVSFDTSAPTPSELEGPFQPRPVDAGPNEDTGLSIGGSAQLRNLGGDNNLTVRLRVGEQVLDGELSYTNPVDPAIAGETGFSVNVFNQRAVQGVFSGGERDVFIPRGYEPWVHRTGGGGEFSYTIVPDLVAGVGLSYQSISIRNRMFSNRIVSEDEFGNPLTASGTGRDDLLTVKVSGEYSQLDDRDNPQRGYRILAGIDQAIPIGEAQINFTRLSANYIQYIPIDLIRTADRSDALILNLQGGTMFGDVPSYEAFNLGSGSTIGYGTFDFGTGASFAQIAAEYRFPITSFEVFNRPIALGAAVFGGYVTDLGTADQVIGEPAIVRDKPGNGFGVGFGLRADTPIGLVRLEIGFSDRGGSVVTLTTGDRF